MGRSKRANRNDAFNGPEGAVIYCRVSTPEQATNYSIPSQKRDCEAYARNAGWQVVAVFVEPGVSAKTTNRPEFRKMLDYCRDNRGKVRHLVVSHTSRFARNAQDHLEVASDLALIGVRLHSVSENLEDTPEGRFIQTIFAAANELDNAQRAQRSLRGMKAAFQSGRWQHAAPIGYRKGNDAKIGPTLLPDEAAPYVCRAFELIAGRAGRPAVVLRELTEAGFRTKSGRPVSLQTFNTMLRNEVYTGWIVERKWKERVRGEFEPLITEDLFWAAQAVLDGRKSVAAPRQKQHPDYPLRGLVRCRVCGTPMTASAPRSKGGTHYRYYHCRRCSGLWFPTDRVERAFEHLLDALRPHDDYFGLLRAVVRQVWREKEQEAGETRSSMSRELTDLQKRQRRYLDLYVDTGKTIYNDRAFELETEIAGKQAALNSRNEESLDVDETLRFAEALMSNPTAMWRQLDTAGKQQLQAAMFPNGVEFADGEFGTPDSPLFFSGLREIGGEKTRVVDQAGVEPATS